VHFLIWVKGTGFESGDVLKDPDSVEYKRVMEFVNKHYSCWLPPPPDTVDEFQAAIEKHPDFNPEQNEFDQCHPCAKRVDPTLDYGWTGPVNAATFADKRVEVDFRSVCLACNMHRCCKTCHKYGHENDCRFEAPWEPINEPILESKMDNKGRLKNKVLAARNNSHINRHAAMPHCKCCWRGNSDATFVCDQFAAGTYCACYASKPEEADSSVMVKFIARALGRPSLQYVNRDILRTTLNAMLGAVRVGATQARNAYLFAYFNYLCKISSYLVK